MQRLPIVSLASVWSGAVLASLGVLAGCAAPPANAPQHPPAPAAPASPVAVPAPEAAPAPAEAAHAARFATWLADFRRFAQAQGIGEPTLRAALDGARFLPRVVELDSAQPEFTRTVWDYLDTAVSAQRVARGQEKLRQVRGAVEAAAARYGVPAEVLAAVWGMESNYGANLGNISTIDALATLGFEGRRGAWARSELLAALKILDNHDIDRGHMTGSWAGAMGHTQFMPSSYLAFAVDADGDGRRDLWSSMPDVMASTANFLARSGWQAGQPWLVEVRLPADFDHGRADSGVRQDSAQWAAEGLQTMDGQPLPALPDAEVLLPAGARGPAFLAGPNFRAIMRYNNSISYGLGVSLLAQRLAGGAGVQAAWPRDLAALSRSQVLALQEALNAKGFSTGTPDGIAGPATRQGIRAYQRSLGLPADGFPSAVLLDSLTQP